LNVATSSSPRRRQSYNPEKEKEKRGKRWATVPGPNGPFAAFNPVLKGKKKREEGGP